MRLQKIDQTGKPYRIYAEALESQAIDQFVLAMQQPEVVQGLPTGRTLWIHRKGATHAEAGMLGIVPGNMKDGSFLVRGKGHPDSLCSSSHGAGRCMSRSQAKKRLDLTTFAEEMAAMGIKARVDAGTLDEAPEAYKDIYEVMRQQADLVEVIRHIKPLINIKG